MERGGAGRAVRKETGRGNKNKKRTRILCPKWLVAENPYLGDGFRSPEKKSISCHLCMARVCFGDFCYFVPKATHKSDPVAVGKNERGFVMSTHLCHPRAHASSRGGGRGCGGSPPTEAGGPPKPIRVRARSIATIIPCVACEVSGGDRGNPNLDPNPSPTRGKCPFAVCKMAFCFCPPLPKGKKKDKIRNWFWVNFIILLEFVVKNR